MVDTIRDGDVARYADFDNRVLRETKRTALTRLPVIDVSPFMRDSTLAERQAVARQIREACIDIGFFYIAGHGIPQDELDRLLDHGRRFFELPPGEKMKIHRHLSPTGQGFMTPGGLDPSANPDKATDLKERFVFNREPLPGEPADGVAASTGPLWPDPAVLPGFEPFIKAHVRKRAELARRMARAFALSLELPEDWFDGVYRYFRGNFLFNWYPSIDPAALQPNQWSFSPHTDYGAFTILSQDSLGGLQARNVAGDWIDVPPIPGTFVVNVGDTLQMWTNDLYVSTLHRAANTSPLARISAVLFTSPQGDTVIECLPSCCGPDNPPRYEPVLSVDYSRALVEQSRRSGRPGVSVRTAERLKTTRL